MSWRRFALVLDRLPEDSEFRTEIRESIDLTTLPEPEPGVYGRWSQGDMLLARIGDLLNHWLWMNADPEKRSQHSPEPYPRPGVGSSNVVPISPAAAEYMAYVRKHRCHPPDDWKPQVG